MERQKQLLISTILINVILVFDLLISDGNIWTFESISSALEGFSIVLCIILSIFAVKNKDDEKKSTFLICAGIILYSAITDYALDITRSAVYFYLVIADIVDLMLVFCLLGFWVGYRHNITRIRNLIAVSAASELLPWFIENPDRISVFDESLLFYLPSMIVLFIFAAYISRSDIIDLPPRVELTRRMSRVESIMVMSEDSYISVDEMAMILERTEEGWIHMDDGPVEKYCTATIIGGTRRTWKLTVRKYRGEEFFRANISPNARTRGDYGFAFDITSYHLHKKGEKNAIRIYGHNGVFIELYVGNPKTEEHNAISDMFDKLIKEF